MSHVNFRRKVKVRKPLRIGKHHRVITPDSVYNRDKEKSKLVDLLRKGE